MSLSAENLQMTIQFIRTPTFVLNKKGKIIAWNKAMTTLTGIPVKSVLNKKSWVVFLPRRKRTPADGVLKDGESRREEFLFLFGKEERKVWFIADPIIEEGTLIGTFVQLEDFKLEERNETTKAVSVEKEIIKEIEAPVEVIREVLVTTDGPEIKKVTDEVAHTISELGSLILKLKIGLEGIDKSNDEALNQIQSIATVSEELTSSVREVSYKFEQSSVTEKLLRDGDLAVVKNKEVAHTNEILEVEVNNILEKMTNLNELMSLLQGGE